MFENKDFKNAINLVFVSKLILKVASMPKANQFKIQYSDSLYKIRLGLVGKLFLIFIFDGYVFDLKFTHYPVIVSLRKIKN